MPPRAQTYEDLITRFLWDIPEFYNMGVDAGFVDDLPMTNMGKIIRRSLRERRRGEARGDA